VIRGCERIIEDEEARNRLLGFLEYAITREDREPTWQVTLVSERELLSHLTGRETEFAQNLVDGDALLDGADVQRWSRVLSQFAVGEERQLPATRGDGSAATPNRQHGAAEESRTRVRRFLQDELAWDDGLAELIEPLAANCSNAQPLTENELLGRIIAAAEPRFRYLWGLCTPREKLLLLYLAREGFVNPKQWALARKLRGRGLMDFGPNFHFTSRSFEIFVNRAVAPESVRRWERTHIASQWRTLSAALLMVIFALVALTSIGAPDFLQDRTGIALTALAGWLITVGRLGLLSRGTVSRDGLLGIFAR